MPKSEGHTLSAFGQAAVALDQELVRFRELAEAGSRIPLTSRRNLEKAARAADEAQASQKRLEQLMQPFIEALTAARQENERCAQALEARRVEVERRLSEVGEILSRFKRLGSIAVEISNFVREVGEHKKAGLAPHETLAALVEVETRMTTVVDEARALAKAAQEAEVSDLVPDIESLRNQVLAARNRTNLLRQQLGGSN